LESEFLEIVMLLLPKWSHMKNTHHQRLHDHIAFMGFKLMDTKQAHKGRDLHSIQQKEAAYRNAHRKSKSQEGRRQSQQK
jgi:hypothetical protein